VFSLKFYAASARHLEWIRERVTSILGVRGALSMINREHGKGLSRRPIFQLSYGNAASRTVAAAIYADPEAPALERKKMRWLAEVASGRF
jgi:hypothetical protein